MQIFKHFLIEKTVLIKEFLPYTDNIDNILITPTSVLNSNSPHSLSITFSEQSIKISYMTEFAQAFYHSFNLKHKVNPEKCTYGFKFDREFTPEAQNTHIDMVNNPLSEGARNGQIWIKLAKEDTELIWDTLYDQETEDKEHIEP
jgi:hypothetical protein